MITNDHKWAETDICLSRDTVVCDLNFGPDCDFMEIQSALARKRYKITEEQNRNF